MWFDGSDARLVRAGFPGEQVQRPGARPLGAEALLARSGAGQVLVRANTDGSAATTLISGLAPSARGLAVRPLENELYYSNGATMVRATLGGGGWSRTSLHSAGSTRGRATSIPNTYLNTPITEPESNLVLGRVVLPSSAPYAGGRL